MVDTNITDCVKVWNNANDTIGPVYGTEQIGIYRFSIVARGFEPVTSGLHTFNLMVVDYIPAAVCGIIRKILGNYYLVNEQGNASGWPLFSIHNRDNFLETLRLLALGEADRRLAIQSDVSKEILVRELTSDEKEMLATGFKTRDRKEMDYQKALLEEELSLRWYAPKHCY